MIDEKTSGLLITKKAIKSYLDINDDTFAYWISQGMPAIVENRRWYAHKANLDEFFRLRTRKRPPKITEGAE